MGVKKEVSVSGVEVARRRWLNRPGFRLAPLLVLTVDDDASVGLAWSRLVRRSDR